MNTDNINCICTILDVHPLPDYVSKWEMHEKEAKYNKIIALYSEKITLLKTSLLELSQTQTPSLSQIPTPSKSQVINCCTN
jgi:hypothetical protein